MFSVIWATSAAVAAIAGVLLAQVSLIDINLGFIGLKAFAAAVLGGFGSIPGALVGGIVIGLIELFSGVYLPQGFKDVAAYFFSSRRRHTRSKRDWSSDVCSSD